jgi:hypothetical protein
MFGRACIVVSSPPGGRWVDPCFDGRSKRAVRVPALTDVWDRGVERYEERRGPDHRDRASRSSEHSRFGAGSERAAAGADGDENTDDRTIGLLDIDGVNFAAVKALEARTAELRVKTAEVDRLNTEVAALRERQATTDARLAELEALVRRMSQQR